MPGRERQEKGEGSPIEARDVDISKEDEMLPKRAKPTREPSREGNVPDTAGEHGKMAPESAKALERAEEGQ